MIQLKYAPLNKILNSAWNAAGTIYVLRQGSETIEQTASRKSADNRILTINTMVPSRVFNNPNITGVGGPIIVIPPGSVYADALLSGPFDFAPIEASIIPNTYKVEQESAETKLVLDMKQGINANNGLAGGIYAMWDKTNNRNQVSNPVYRPGYCGDCGYVSGTIDLGSGINMAYYRLPAPNWNYNGTNLTIGDNPLEYGDEHGQSSQLLQYGRATVNGQVLDYTKVKMAQWSGPNTGESLKFDNDILEKWTTLSGNRTIARYRLKLNRSSGQGGDNAQNDARNQEMPSFYANGSLNKIYLYDGDFPYTNQSPRLLTLEDNWGQPQGDAMATENWIATIGADGRGVGMITPTTNFQYGHYNGDFNLADGTGFGRAYMSWQPKINVDKNIELKYEVIYVTGTLAEIRAAAYEYTQAKYKETPEFKFNKPGRQWWSYRNANDGGFQASRTSWGITWNGENSQIISPGGAWKTTQKHIYMRYRYTASNRGSTSLTLFWRNARTADFNLTGASGEQQRVYDQRYPAGNNVDNDHNVSASVSTDGQWYIADFNMTNKPAWSGIINSFTIHSDGAPSANERIEIDWISASPTGPTV